MAKIDIRPMSSGDKPVVMHILQTTPEFNPGELVVAEELIDAFLNKGEASGYYIDVAEYDEGVVGYVCYGRTPLTDATWDIYWIAVARSEQGAGIGHELMRKAEEEIREMYGRLIMIETSGKPEYDKTRRFYEHYGFRCMCRIPDYYVAGEELVIFARYLNKDKTADVI